MKYIMVTHWENHWDHLRDNRTLFTKTMFRSQMNKAKLIDYTKTIFIKKDRESRKLEKCWIGKVYNFKEGPYRDFEAIYFSVTIDKEIICPIEYLERAEGWYCEDAVVSIPENIPARNNVITEDRIRKITIKEVFQMLGQLS